MTQLETRTGDGLWFQRFGEGAKPWLTLTHGAFCSSEDWAPFVESLSRTHNLLLWDLPGHGRSRDAPLLKSLPDGARALARVMDSAGIDRNTHLGCSFGGMLAQAFARNFPARTDALLAYACVPITAVRIPAPSLARLLIRLQFLLTPRRRFADSFARKATCSAKVERSLHATILNSPPGLAPAIWTAMTAGVSHEPAFRHACPVALVTGELDDRFPHARGLMEAWGRALPEGLWIDIPGTGHVPHLERPELFGSALEQVLARLR
jgi:3-oxoadipate enol-lactonase